MITLDFDTDTHLIIKGDYYLTLAQLCEYLEWDSGQEFLKELCHHLAEKEGYEASEEFFEKLAKKIKP